jgi:hypothetical protein
LPLFSIKRREYGCLKSLHNSRDSTAALDNHRVSDANSQTPRQIAQQQLSSASRFHVSIQAYSSRCSGQPMPRNDERVTQKSTEFPFEKCLHE